MTAALSPICGTHFGLTKLVTSISFSPAAWRRCTSSILTAASTACFSFCRPSRGPTSTRVTLLGRALIGSPRSGLREASADDSAGPPRWRRGAGIAPGSRSSPASPRRATPRVTKSRTGCAHDSQRTNGTSPSPSSDRAMFENGSGEVLAAARVVALARWLVAARPPPSSAAAVVQVASSPPKAAAASAAPAGMRITRVQRVPDAVEAGNLVDEELDEAGARRSRRAATGSAGCAGRRAGRPSRAHRRRR